MLVAGDEHVHRTALEELGGDGLLAVRQTLVVESNAVLQGPQQSLVFDVRKVLLDFRQGHPQEHPPVLCSCQVTHQLHGHVVDVPLLGHKDHHGLVRAVRADSHEGGLVHRHHPRGEPGVVKTLNVNLQRHWPHRGVEVEDRGVRGSHPLSKILCIGQGAAGRDKTDPCPKALDHLRADVPHPGHDHLHHRPPWAHDEMQLVYNEELHTRDVLSLLPPSGDDIPVLRGADNNLALFQQLEVRAGLTSELHHGSAKAVIKLALPLAVPLRADVLVRGDVHRSGLLLRLEGVKHPQNGELNANGLS
eukprot:RCo009881